MSSLFPLGLGWILHGRIEESLSLHDMSVVVKKTSAEEKRPPYHHGV
jgi:hypothetical protein